MKKEVIIIGLILLSAATWYFMTQPSTASAASIKSKVKVRYIGPDIMYTGLMTSAGDIITGVINNDGTLTYTMWGNGIMASSHDFIIPSSAYINISKSIPGMES